MPELWIVDDDGAVYNDECVKDVVILDELEEGLKAVPGTEVRDGIDASVQLSVFKPDLHLVSLVRVPRQYGHLTGYSVNPSR